jgi:hypothetical protein
MSFIVDLHKLNKFRVSQAPNLRTTKTAAERGEENAANMTKTRRIHANILCLFAGKIMELWVFFDNKQRKAS